MSRDKILEKFEEKCAVLQKELEEHCDKRQNIWKMLTSKCSILMLETPSFFWAD